MATVTPAPPAPSATRRSPNERALLGVFPTVVMIAALRRRPWAALGHVAVGVTLMGWIVVQVGVLGPPIAAIQVLYFAYGLVVLLLALRLRRPTT